MSLIAFTNLKSSIGVAMAFECSQLAGLSAFPGSGDALINSTKAQMKERLREKVLVLWNDEWFLSDTD